MKIRPEILDRLPEVSARLPAGFDLEATARLGGVFTRVREIKNAETLLQLALAYGVFGVSLLERLCNAAPWLGDIVTALIANRPRFRRDSGLGYRLRALDGTAMKAAG